MKDDNKNRINWLIKGVILLAVILIAAMVAIDVMADYGNYPYLFFLKDLCTWVLIVNPFLLILLLWVFRRHSIACRLGSHQLEEVKKAKEENQKLSRGKLVFMFVGLSLFFLVAATPGPMILADLPHLSTPSTVEVRYPWVSYESYFSYPCLEGIDDKGHNVVLTVSNNAMQRINHRADKEAPVQAYICPTAESSCILKRNELPFHPIRLREKTRSSSLIKKVKKGAFH